MAIRPANTVSIIRKRLSQVETGVPEPMELVNLLDEIQRQERKWRDFEKQGMSRRTNPSDYTELGEWYTRLNNVMQRALRTLPADIDPMEKEFLTKAAVTCKNSGNGD